MSFLKRLFGRKSATPAQIEPASTPARDEPANEPALITVFDAFGQQLQIPRDEWRTNILPENFRKSWDNPDELASHITQALHDGFVAEALEPARQLHQIDPQPHRSAALLAVVLLQLQQYADVEDVVKATVKQHGENGILLTNLAKAQAGQGDEPLAERTLWHALEIDPNQDNGMLWYVAIHGDRGGDPARQDALRKIASLPRSWRARLWLARAALTDKDLGGAMTLYREALARVEPAPADMLMQISGDLGNHGALDEIIALVAPKFDPALHGLMVGNNIIKAHVERGQAAPARALLERMYAQQRPDWRENLSFWDGEIDKLEKNYGPVEPTGQLSLACLALDKPVWASASAPFDGLLPARSADAVRVCFVAGSAAVPGKGDQVVSMPADGLGRFTRGLPMLLAERMHLRTEVQPVFVLPWFEQTGFVLAAVPWTPDLLSDAGIQADYAVFLHVVASGEPWRANLKLVRLSDRSTIAEWAQNVSLDDPSPAIEQILEATLDRVAGQLNLAPTPPAADLQPPTDGNLVTYLVATEQCLAIFCASRMADAGKFLSQERDILENLLRLCASAPANALARLLLLSAFDREVRRRPDIVKEFEKKLEHLQQQYPLGGSIRVQSLAELAKAAILARLPST